MHGARKSSVAQQGWRRVIPYLLRTDTNHTNRASVQLLLEEQSAKLNYRHQRASSVQNAMKVRANRGQFA
jgi:hypothetical protein